MPSYFYRADTVKVKSGASYLNNPWAGGFNNPQFSEIDLNFDGVKDIFVFDRSGDKVVTFLNNGAAGITDYKHAPEYESLFPKMMDWAFLADYNCDGKEDIFTHTSGAMAVYRNDGNAIDGLKFTLITSALLSDYLTDTIPITVNAVSLPTITDIDGDGDLDILNYATNNIYVEYHQNQSIELYGTCDSLAYKIEANCWGYFSENAVSNDVNLNDTCSPLKMNGHAGSTLLAIDLDGDNDKDLLVGDISFSNLVMLTNGGDSQNAYMASQDYAFPSSSSPVNLTIFPCAYYVDVNNDSAKDLLVTPSASNVSENVNSVWYYRNTGTTAFPNFTLESKSLFQDEMIELGEGAYPVFFDYNTDGLSDLVVGNYGYYNNTGSYQSGLALYENTGTSVNPEFKLISTDYASIASLGMQNIIPSFGDMDNDGDEDMIIGNKDGALHYFKNSAGAGNTASFTLTEAFYKGIDVGNFSAPFIYDINSDSKLDLIVGEQNGNLNYYENTGTSLSPAFTAISSFFGEVDVRQDGSILGYSVPCVYKINGETNLFVASESGDIYHYTNIDNNLTGAFTVEDTTTGNIFEGERSGVNVNDLNNDGLVDLVVGNYDGGIALYYGSNPAGVKNIHQPFSGIKKTYPNPADDNLAIDFGKDNYFSQIIIFDQMGNEIYKHNLGDKKSITITTSNFSGGLYNIIAYGKNEYTSCKFVVLH